MRQAISALSISNAIASPASTRARGSWPVFRSGASWPAVGWDNDGELLAFQYQAHGTGTIPSADQPGMAGICTAIAPSYGGEVDTYAELDVTMPCDGKPTKIVAAFPATAASEEASAETEAA